jgi:hypothetical protein
MIALTLIEWILDLFRDEDAARAFVASPEQTMRDAGLAGVTAGQLANVAATAVPGLALDGGDPIVGLQRAVSHQYGFAPVYQPSPVFAPSPTYAPSPTFAPQTDLASHNDTALLSPTQDAGANAQQGGFNLGFGDITFGSKTTNTATDGAVVVNGRNNGDIVSGDGAVLGNENGVNNGVVRAEHGSNVSTGADSVIRESHSSVGGSQTTTTVGGSGNTTATDGRDTSTTTVTHRTTTDNSTHDNSHHTTTVIDSSTHDDSSHSLFDTSHDTTLLNSHLDNSHEMSLASGNHLLGF